MAIHDLLWGCPLCRQLSTIRKAGRRERCAGCGAVFRRGAGAAIIARRGAAEEARSAAEWLRLLGEPPPPEPNDAGVLLGPEPVVYRIAEEQRPIRNGRELLGWIEIFGPKFPGSITLTADLLAFEPDAGGVGYVWPLDTLTAVQPASSALQVAAGRRVASLRFRRTSLRLWTRALTTALRRVHAAQGRAIVEFQPFLRTEPLTVEAAGP